MLWLISVQKGCQKGHLPELIAVSLLLTSCTFNFSNYNHALKKCSAINLIWGTKTNAVHSYIKLFPSLATSFPHSIHSETMCYHSCSQTMMVCSACRAGCNLYTLATNIVTAVQWFEKIWIFSLQITCAVLMKCNKRWSKSDFSVSDVNISIIDLSWNFTKFWLLTYVYLPNLFYKKWNLEILGQI